MAKSDTAARYARYDALLAQANMAASEAQKGMVEDRNAFDCGFAWVVVHDRAFATWCRKQMEETRNPAYYGSKHYAGGWSFWKPGGAPVQSISIHEAGARAFRDVLAHGLQCRVEVGSRLD